MSSIAAVPPLIRFKQAQRNLKNPSRAGFLYGGGPLHRFTHPFSCSCVRTSSGLTLLSDVKLHVACLTFCALFLSIVLGALRKRLPSAV